MRSLLKSKLVFASILVGLCLPVFGQQRVVSVDTLAATPDTNKIEIIGAAGITGSSSSPQLNKNATDPIKVSVSRFWKIFFI